MSKLRIGFRKILDFVKERLDYKQSLSKVLWNWFFCFLLLAAFMAIPILIAEYIVNGRCFDFTGAGFRVLFVDMLGVPMYVLALSIPVLGIVAALHRSHQTDEQLSESRKINTLNNYYKHKEEFEDFFEKVVKSEKIKWSKFDRDLFDSNFFKNQHALASYFILWPRSREDGGIKCSEDKVIELVEFSRKIFNFCTEILESETDNIEQKTLSLKVYRKEFTYLFESIGINIHGLSVNTSGHVKFYDYSDEPHKVSLKQLKIIMLYSQSTWEKLLEYQGVDYRLLMKDVVS
ncbi:hypothetical protein NFC81_09165 [Salinispirillum sp. LH 10-3-1]|uniref:Uncharacterized protein n=1 Tax=Salinispirillum sp. LH 10-3-1 TaxID=2952525 RepID=A0AB38YC00_9GAMM